MSVACICSMLKTLPETTNQNSSEKNLCLGWGCGNMSSSDLHFGCPGCSAVFAASWINATLRNNAKVQRWNQKFITCARWEWMKLLHHHGNTCPRIARWPVVSEAEDSEPGGINGTLRMIAEPNGLQKQGHKLGSETESRITREKGLGTSALWLVAVVRALTTYKCPKENVSTTRLRYLAKLGNLDVTKTLKKQDLRLGRREESYNPDQSVNQK